MSRRRDQEILENLLRDGHAFLSIEEYQELLEQGNHHASEKQQTAELSNDDKTE